MRRTLTRDPCTVFGKQVRGNVPSADLVAAFSPPDAIR